MRRITFLLIANLINLSGQSQGRHFSGTIKDMDTNQAIEHCSVTEAGTQNSTLTDKTGAFTIALTLSGHETHLIFQATGYEQKTLPASKNDHTIIFLKRHIKELDEIVISGVPRATLLRENPASITAITSEQLVKTPASNMIDALVKNVPGLHAVKTGPNISKPLIHGLGYNRVLTLYDGMRQEGQQYGEEHGIELDDYNIEKAEVIKGPASLLYGSDAIAGVISIYPFIPNRPDGKLHGKLINEFHTNNNLTGNSIRINYARERIIFSFNASYRQAKNYRNPVDGRVYMTNYNLKNFSGLAGYKTAKAYINLNLTMFDNRQGIPDGSRDSVSRRFTKQIREDEDDILNRPFVSSSELNAYKIPNLFQHIQHYRIYTNSNLKINNGEINVLIGWQQNTRKEYSHPTAPDHPGMHMELNTLNYGIRYNPAKGGAIETSFGINGMLQKNRNRDATDFPIPDYNLSDCGFYSFGKWKRNKWAISGGLRIDLRLVSWADFFVRTNTRTGFEEQTGADNTLAELRFSEFKKTYYGMSASMGATYKANAHLSLKANIGRAYRAPGVTETGSNGLDPGAHIFYLGDRTLKPEFSIQEDLGIHLKLNELTADISFFNHHISNFIFTTTVADDSGNPITDAVGNRTYSYTQSTAHLYGGELWFAVHPAFLKGLRLDNSLSMVYGFNRKAEFRGKKTEGEYLPFIPPITIHSSLSRKIKFSSRWFCSLTPKIDMEYAAEQKRFAGLNGAETKTPSYLLVHAGLFSEIKFRNYKSFNILLDVTNLFDKAYQSHLNRLKYFEHFTETPNGRYGIYNMGRNLILKMLFSF